MITAAQLRAARALVDWSRTELADAADVSAETIKNIEHGIFRPQEETTEQLVKTFAAHGVVFTANEGVQIQKDAVTRLEGVDGFKRLMDDVYKSACEPSASEGSDNFKPICVSNVDDRLFVKYLGDYMPFHAKRMDALKTVRVRALLRENDHFVIPNCFYPEYRWSPSQTHGSVPFYVYGDKFAVLLLDIENAEKIEIVVIASAPVAKAYREQFDLIWQNSKSVKKNARTI